MEDVMIQKGRHEKIYYISDRHEKGVLKKLRFKIMGGIFGGAVLTVGSLAVILIYLRLL